MKALTVQLKVDIARPQGVETLRVAGFLDDGETIAIATMAEGASRATHELSCRIGDVAQLAEACLAGNERALTTPGLARMLAATTALLFRVALTSGGIEKRLNHEDAGIDGHCGDREEAAADEYSGE